MSDIDNAPEKTPEEKEFKESLKSGFKSLTGRPSHYRPEFDEIVLKLAAEGKTMAGICGHFLVSRSTLYRWAEEHPHFRDTLDTARELQQIWMEEIANKHAVENKDGARLNTTLWNFRMSRTVKDYKDQAQLVINKTIEDTKIPDEVKDKLDSLEAKIRNTGKR